MAVQGFFGSSFREESTQQNNDNNWRLINKIDLTASNSKLLINKDLDGNDFSCKEMIIVGKVVSNAMSKPLCKINGETQFSGVSSTYINGERYIYDTYSIKGTFIERDMKYLNQDILENSVLFDNGFFRVIKKEMDSIKSIEYYGDSASFTFKSGTKLEIYGR